MGRHLQPQAHRGGGRKAATSRRSAACPCSTAGTGSPYTRYVPVPNSPHGINTAPDGIHFVANGKLSPTVTVFDARKLDDLFDDKIKPRDVVVAEPELGLGPLHTAYDGKGNAYTTLFLDSQVCKWNIDAAKRAFRGEKVNPIVQKLDVHYQPGHNHTSMGQTKEADGKWLLSLNKFSKDRFLNVGPLKPENDQLIDISGDRWCSCTTARASPSRTTPPSSIARRSTRCMSGTATTRSSRMRCKQAAADGVTLEADCEGDPRRQQGARLHDLGGAGLRPGELHGEAGRRGHGLRHQHRRVEDLTHGFCIINYGINMEIGTAADLLGHASRPTRPGVYWYYCTWFCHAHAHGDAGPHAGRAAGRLTGWLSGSTCALWGRRRFSPPASAPGLRRSEFRRAGRGRPAGGPRRGRPRATSVVLQPGEHRGPVTDRAQGHARGRARRGPARRRPRQRRQRDAPGAVVRGLTHPRLRDATSRRWTRASSSRRARGGALVEGNSIEGNLYGVYIHGAPKTRSCAETRSSAMREGRTERGRQRRRRSGTRRARKVLDNDIRFGAGRHLLGREPARTSSAATASATCASPSTTCTRTTSEVSDNVSIGNTVGYAIMYSHRLMVRGNVSDGDRDRGMLFNFANGSQITGNTVLGRRRRRNAGRPHPRGGAPSSTGCLPTTPGRAVGGTRIGPEKCVFIYNTNQNRFRGNWFEGCEIGIHFTAGSEGNEIVGNAFVRQPQPGEICRHPLSRLVEGRARQLLERQSRPSTSTATASPTPPIGRTTSSTTVLWTAPQAKILVNSPAVQVIRWAQAQFPAHPARRRRRQPSADGAARPARMHARRRAMSGHGRASDERVASATARSRRCATFPSTLRAARRSRSSATTAPARQR